MLDTYNSMINKFVKDNGWARRYIDFIGRISKETKIEVNVRRAIWSSLWVAIDIGEEKEFQAIFGIKPSSPEWTQCKGAYSGVGKSDEKIRFFKGKPFKRMTDAVILEPYTYVPKLVGILETAISKRGRFNNWTCDIRSLQHLIQ